MSYSSGSASGALAFGGNGSGNSSNQLNGPVAIHFDSPSSSFLTLNRDSSTLVRWKLGDMHWSLVAGSAQGIDAAHDVTVDPMGNIYLADRDHHRILFFNAGEHNGVTIAGKMGSAASDSKSIAIPFGLALDNQLNLYVADTGNHRIQKFLRY